MTEEAQAGSEAFTTEEDDNTCCEEFKIAGSDLVAKIKELVHEGNIRRIVIKQNEDTVLELPLTVAAVGAIIAPVLAAVGAFAALVTNCSIVVERIVEE